MTFSEQGIIIKRNSGQVKTKCPKCSQDRKKKADPCLSVNIDDGIWNCHNCGWNGGLKKQNNFMNEKPFVLPKEINVNQVYSEKLIKWFYDRGISSDTMMKNRIAEGKEYMPQLGKETTTIQFKYFRDSKLINVKYRDAAKNFKLVKDAERVMYGLDDLLGKKEVIIVEGEMDKLAFYEAGYKNCVSVPNGASNLKMEYLKDFPEDLEKVYLAVDNDEPGKKLQEELSRRIGRDICYRVTYPDGCKDINDVLITYGSGMTGVVNKFQRILGLKVSESLKNHTNIPEEIRPIVFISHMEHHSNQTSWLETIADVIVVPCNEEGLICLDLFESCIKEHEHRKIKIVSMTSCSNVTGIKTPYHKVAKLIHSYNGLCFVDFACCAPYVHIDMHPKDKEESLDAIFFSPHKFLGGPGSAGVLIFNKKLYKNTIPDNPGGGTVSYTNPWGQHDYFDDVETREDGGTPAFLQTIRVALSIQLKEQMGTENIKDRENEVNKVIFETLENLEGVKILAPNQKIRLSIFSFYFEKYHFNLVVKLLNDRFGIQTQK